MDSLQDGIDLGDYVKRRGVRKPGGGHGLARQALILFASRIVVLGMNFAAGILVARGLGPAGRGIYAVAVLIPVLITQAVSFGLNGAAVYFTGQGRYPLRQIVSSLFWAALLLGCGSALIAGWGLSDYGSYILGEFPVSLLPMALACLPFLIWADLLGHVLLGQERTASFALLGVIQAVILVVVQTSGFLWARGQIEVALGGWLLSQVAAGLSAILMVGKHTRPGVQIDRTFLRGAIRYGRAGYVAGWLQFLNYRLDQFLVNSWIGSAALGQYAVAVSLTEALWQLPVSVGSVLFARVATVSGREGQAPTSQVCRLTLLAMFALTIPVALLARPLFSLVFGSLYEQAVPSLYALLPGTVALVLPNVVGGYLYGQGMQHYVTYGAGISLLMTMLADMLLIPSLGIVGAGLASSSAYVVYAGAMMIFAHRVSGEPWPSFLVPRRSDWHWFRETLIASLTNPKSKEKEEYVSLP